MPTNHLQSFLFLLVVSTNILNSFATTTNRNDRFLLLAKSSFSQSNIDENSNPKLHDISTAIPTDQPAVSPSPDNALTRTNVPFLDHDHLPNDGLNNLYPHVNPTHVNINTDTRLQLPSRSDMWI